jgi:hypothetical protein
LTFLQALLFLDARSPSYPERQRNASSGWSSIASGATPVWPCLKSKNATPVTRARAHSRTFVRASAICRRRSGVAPIVHDAEGDSAIEAKAMLAAGAWELELPRIADPDVAELLDEFVAQPV